MLPATPLPPELPPLPPARARGARRRRPGAPRGAGGATTLGAAALLGLVGLAGLAGLRASPGAGPTADGGEADEGTRLFREEVLPLLAKSCFRCHGPDETVRVKGGFRMKGRHGLLAGGSSGPAIVPGDAEASLLVHLVRYEDPEREMPPKRRLSPEGVATLERWIELGAPWPPGEGGAPAEEVAPEAEPELAPELARFFEERVRPVLAENCFECHGPEVPHPKSGFRMAGRAGFLRGGERGPALVPGDVAASRLATAIAYTDAELKMPPSGPLDDGARADLRRWIELGAPWPGYEGGPAAAAKETGGIDLDAGREWWAFRPVVRPPVPEVRNAGWVRNPIDAFVLARLQAAGLEPSPPATPRELVRRASYDLVGLPPTYQEVLASEQVASARDTWLEDLVDVLLNRPGYGERQARQWLDLVRFAQTNGYERDAEKPYAWRYRDWVVRAFQDDVPYDRFLTEQLAGDELPDATPRSRVATGFFRIGLWDDEPNDPEEAKYDELDDVLRVVSEGMLGMTLGCARCHDHKFDPLPQDDYYRMLAFLKSVRPYEEARFALDSSALAPIDLSPRRRAQWERDRRRAIDGARAELDALTGRVRARIVQQRVEAAGPEARRAFTTAGAGRTPEQRALVAKIEGGIDPQAIQGAFEGTESRRAIELTQRIDELKDSFEGDLDWALVAKEFGREPRPTNVLIRGRAASPGREVQPGFPRVLFPADEDSRPALPEPPPATGTTGLRRTLAGWIASPRNPLTARVFVNRVWQQHFGRGLVATPNDFGRQGVPPTHPELLDWLAAEFVESGWSVKRLHRLIMSSATYRMSSRAAGPGAEQDPANELLWRQNPRRLEAEAIRDTLLDVAGILNREAGGRGYFPALSREAMSGASRPGIGWEVSSEAQRDRRGLYAFVKRSMLVPELEVFDFPSPTLPTGKRATTTLSTQALVLLNSAFSNRVAAAFTERVLAEAPGSPDAQARRAFLLALGRPPTDAEQRVLDDYLAAQTAAFAAAPSRLRFGPLVPERLDLGYIDQLGGADLLYGPRDGWVYAKGEWGGLYNGTVTADALRGPAAVDEAVPFEDGVVEARVRLDRGAALASLIVRGAVREELLVGLELVLDPEGFVELRWHDESVVPLARAPATIEPDRWCAVRIELAGPRVRVWLDDDGAPRLEADEPAAEKPGGFGVRTVGEAVELADVRVHLGDAVATIGPDDPGRPERRALESLCLALLNLNELVYVD